MPRAPVDRKLAAIFAADIVGYSRLMAHDEMGTLARLKASRAIMDRLITSHRGRIFNTAGDSVVADFASAVNAVKCAAAVQAALAPETAGQSPDDRIAFRIGVHVGDVIVDGTNLLGDGVNIAARLEALAEPDSVCISAAVREQIGNKLPLDFDDLGEQQIKNIPHAVRVYRVRAGAGPLAPPRPALALPDKPSIAVLPFQNISGDPEQEYFADGMVEEIITALSRIRWLFVIARNSSFTYKGQAIDVKQVGRELGVRYVLEGSVRKAGQRVRITAQLVDAASGGHLWADRYDRDLADVFAVQDEIMERVGAAVEPQLFAAEYVRSERTPPERLDAWELVVRAVSSAAQNTQAGTAEAEALCRRAVAMAPRYGQAHSLLAWVLMQRAYLSGALNATLPEASTEVRAALAIDERDPWAHLAQGVVLFRMKRHTEAEAAYRVALEFNPNFALAHGSLGQALAAQGKHRAAAESAEHALRLSPGDALVGGRAAHTIVFARFAEARYAEAIALARPMIERYPEFLPFRYVLIAALGTIGDAEEAAAALAELLRLKPDFSMAWLLENMAWGGEIGERLIEGWRKSKVPEK